MAVAAEAYTGTTPSLGDDEGVDDGTNDGAGGGRYGGVTPSILVVMGIAGTLVLRCRVAAAYERYWPGTRLAVTVGQA